MPSPSYQLEPEVRAEIEPPHACDELCLKKKKNFFFAIIISHNRKYPENQNFFNVAAELFLTKFTLKRLITN